MDKEMLEIVNDLSKKPTTELALQIMELSAENLILEQQCKKQKKVIDKAIDKLYSIPIEATRQEIIDIARETLHILKEVEQE